MKTGTTELTVGEVAAIARISIRTLHHYDRLGLLSPSRRSEAGYRVYTREDLRRLQQVLFYRELGLALASIRDLMGDPGFDRHAALLDQRRQLTEKLGQLGRMKALVEDAIAEIEGETQMSNEGMFEAFGDFDPSEYEDEVKERWGDTPAYKESRRRARSYSADDWKRFKEEGDSIHAQLAELMDAEVAPDDARSLAAVERMRLQIDTWFYPCSHEMHAALGRMYVEDPRFTETYEKIRPGMAQFIMLATEANVRRQDETNL